MEKLKLGGKICYENEKINLVKKLKTLEMIFWGNGIIGGARTYKPNLCNT